MALLLAGLIVFIGMHSARIVADARRSAFIARHGERAWKALFSAVSAAGLVLLVVGYGAARRSSALLWDLGAAGRYAGIALVLLSFVFIAAAYVPGNAIKARLRHPMVLGTKLWAAGHLLANGSWADALLFGAFLLWAVSSFRAARRREREQVQVSDKGRAGPTLTAVAVGLVGAWVFMVWLHGPLIGVRPLP